MNGRSALKPILPQSVSTCKKDTKVERYFLKGHIMIAVVSSNVKKFYSTSISFDNDTP
ncbi:hypothetical protein C8R42DRAFT_652531 [Lentinula raphanica]|nr:hypothetical protein C8R42DRAFT_652531 [Lentinula raphanica]